jgi:hypothetical protein
MGDRFRLILVGKHTEIVVATEKLSDIFHVPFARKTWPRFRGSGGHGNLKANADN